MSFSEAPLLAITGFFTIGLGLLLLIFGYIMAINKQFKRHQQLMVAAATVNALFLVQYVIRFLTVGETKFRGNEFVKLYVYYPILLTHIATAVISIYFVGKQLLSSWKQKKVSPTGAPYFDKDFRDQHRSFGRKTFYIWLTSFIGGIIVFLFLYVLF